MQLLDIQQEKTTWTGCRKALDTVAERLEYAE
jgi:hypothetical protein